MNKAYKTYFLSLFKVVLASVMLVSCSVDDDIQGNKTIVSDYTANNVTMKNGYWDANLGIMLYAYGDTAVTITKKNSCTRLMQVTVLEAEENTEDITLVPSEKAAACKYLRDGVLYIRREGKEYDLMGKPNKQ